MTFCRVLSAVAVLAMVSAHTAQAQFGGMPGLPGSGMGGPGFGGPPAGPPPACQQLMVMRDETQKNAAAIKAAGEKAASQHKPPDPVETCKLFKVFLATEAKFIQGMTESRTTCGVPPDAIKQAQDGHGKASQIAKQVCEVAEHPRPTGPSLSDALNSAPNVPNADNTKTGRGTYDTLQGNALAR
jgi:hypothetical protein